MTTVLKICTIASTIAVILLSLSSVKNKETFTSTQIFCAYGQIFVEFNEGDHKWGTLWLDRQGKPVPCRENDPNVENYLKGNYNESV